MEKQLPADSTSPSSASVGSSNAPAQPTYTTAGTIYNPSSSQPLQPPTRRGRSLKWTSGGVYSDLSLLPRSLLASLQANSTTGRSSPYQTAQYTPLQQNYDRAANPTVKSDYVDDMPSRWSARAASPATESDVLTGYITSDADHDGDNEDDDDESIDNIMMNMTVKSLHNLSSYPNPNQRKAQKALLRPVKPILNLVAQHGTGGGDLPVLPTSWETRRSPDLAYDRSWARPRLSNSDSVASHMMARAELKSIAEKGRGPRPSPSPNSETGDQNAAWLAHLALTSNRPTPRPLTAGPPGQRQYRASTFKSTFKALSTETKPAKQMDDDDAYAVTARVLQHAGIEDARGKLEGSLAGHDRDVANYAQLLPGSQVLQRGSPGNSYGIVGSSDEKAQSGHGRRLDGIASGEASLARPEWGKHVSYAAERSLGHSEYEARFATYMDKMNELWYAGCETLCNENAAVGGDKAMETCVGAVGDGRPIGDGRHGKLKIEEANKMDVSEHAKTLLDMAMANLERSLGEMLKTGYRCR